MFAPSETDRIYPSTTVMYLAPCSLASMSVCVVKGYASLIAQKLVSRMSDTGRPFHSIAPKLTVCLLSCTPFSRLRKQGRGEAQAGAGRRIQSLSRDQVQQMQLKHPPSIRQLKSFQSRTFCGVCAQSIQSSGSI
ncbi:hypothetical protein CC77DRAFT_446991 [Alternaria alternata]|uniref:Uncharacterized protein n=1 Tax=Alternaria alternata TaxID=5599 RepID=A0A177D872_ALTAL|nr:hypothetical protein CC77DRAFT_446991 [Alternaria alternata]OAG15497.1 hypothetical protein CC77DRAFT_446991 [Alternaria alternata]